MKVKNKTVVGLAFQFICDLQTSTFARVLKTNLKFILIPNHDANVEAHQA